MTAAAAAAKAPAPRAPAAPLIVFEAPPVNMGIEEEELLEAPGVMEADGIFIDPEAMPPIPPMPPMPLIPLLMEPMPLIPLLMEPMLLLVPEAMVFVPTYAI